VAARDAGTLRMVEQAVRHRHVLLAYQPAVHAALTDRVAFWEALIRVLDETGRIIPAREFIHQVEETETGRILDCLALEKGLRTLSRVPDLRLSINMSARSIGYRRWMRILERVLRSDATVGERLILEISEASVARIPEVAGSFITDLRHRGISFALDDFGAGDSAFRHFRDLQFDILKIDGSYTRDISGNADNQVLTRGIVALARELDLFTVAGRVETVADAEDLARLGVDCLQGYAFGAPTTNPPWSGAASWLERSAG
jgi:EAL domain-containing protein (putative c-di-GMP-specific phosphodiesterase class I)